MANLSHKSLFFTTSPRSPEKMLPEIGLLWERFGGRPWNVEIQGLFADALAESDFYRGEGSPKNKEWKARDRITRAPKALGFVDLKPEIGLTPAGKALIYGKRPQEAFLRQLLKFQLPSPFHKESAAVSGTFWIRPYLEIMRLIADLDGLSFDECKIFAVQLTDYRRYDSIRRAILDFRREKAQRNGEYKQLVQEAWTRSVLQIFGGDIRAGATKTRQSADAGLKEFIGTKKRTMRDYADACFRYLRFTGLFAYRRRSIVVSPDKVDDVSYLLATADRDPVHISNVSRYKKYLFDADSPLLYTDNKDNLIHRLMQLGPYTRNALSGLSLKKLKDLRDAVILEKRSALIKEQETRLKSYALYQEVIDTFDQIVADDLYDAPLFLEWNTWRAMTMMGGGSIQGNFKIDDLGRPLSTAPGNMPDIECDYGDFVLSIEVTLQSGQRQYEAEGEPVARHFGQLRRRTGKETYCLFIAPAVNPAALAHFFVTNKTEISYYGGKTRIIPLDLDQFMRLIENSYVYHSRSRPAHIRSFLDAAMDELEKAKDEAGWKEQVQRCVEQWPAPPV